MLLLSTVYKKGVRWPNRLALGHLALLLVQYQRKWELAITNETVFLTVS